MAKDDWLWPWPQIDNIRTEHWFVNHNVSQCANLKIDVLCIAPMVEKSHIYCCYQCTVERNQSLSQCVTICHMCHHSDWYIVHRGAQSSPYPRLIFNPNPFHTYLRFVRFFRILDQRSILYTLVGHHIGATDMRWVRIDCNALDCKRKRRYDLVLILRGAL